MKSASCLLDEEASALSKATTFSELSEVALPVLHRMFMQQGGDSGVPMVVGPISADGGFLNRELNMQVFREAVAHTQCMTGRLVFNRLFFEGHFQRIIGLHGAHHQEVLFPAFYEPLFASRLLCLYTMPNCSTSPEARFARWRAVRYGVQLTPLSVECSHEFLVRM